jgi:hypothetical protein
MSAGALLGEGIFPRVRTDVLYIYAGAPSDARASGKTILGAPAHTLSATLTPVVSKLVSAVPERPLGNFSFSSLLQDFRELAAQDSNLEPRD